MKKQRTAILAALFLLMPLMVFCAAKKHESPKQSFKSSANWNKLDGRFKQTWEKAMDKGDTNARFECLIKTQSKPTGSSKRKLADAGFTLRATTGRISSGSVIAGDVPNVAALPFVEFMELAIPLTPKK